MSKENPFEDIIPTPSIKVGYFGEYQGYTGKPCANCGRYRVERYSSGFEICENAIGVHSWIIISLMMNFMKAIFKR